MKAMTRCANQSTLVKTNTKGDETISTPELNNIYEMTNNASVIDHQEISKLTKLILKLKPEQVDETVQSRLAEIMLKVKTQYA